MPLHLQFTDAELSTSAGRVKALQRTSVELAAHAQRVASGDVSSSTSTSKAPRASRPRSPPRRPKGNSSYKGTPLTTPTSSFPFHHLYAPPSTHATSSHAAATTRK